MQWITITLVATTTPMKTLMTTKAKLQALKAINNQARVQVCKTQKMVLRASTQQDRSMMALGDTRRPSSK